MKKALWIAVIVILLLIGWSYSKDNNDSAKEGGQVTIGVSAPLSGEAASYGAWIKAGIDTALKEVNDAGGVNGQPVKVIYEDDKCGSSGVAAYQKLTSVDKVTAIIGSVCSSAAGPAVPIAESAKVPAIIWASAPSLPIGKDYIFRSYPSDAFQGKFAAEYIYNTLGKKKVAVLYVKNDWGQGVHDSFVKSYTELGGSVVFDDSVTQDTKDFRTIIAKINETDAELAYIPLYPANATAAVKEMKALGMTLPLFGGDSLETEEFTSVPEANGVMFTTGRLAVPSEDFKTKVQGATTAEVGFLSPLAYDTFLLLVEAIKEAGTDADAIKDALNDTSYKGISMGSTIEFDGEGDLKTAEFDVKVVEDGKVEMVK